MNTQERMDAGIGPGGTMVACALGNVRRGEVVGKAIPTNGEDGAEAVDMSQPEFIMPAAAGWRNSDEERRSDALVHLPRYREDD